MNINCLLNECVYLCGSYLQFGELYEGVLYNIIHHRLTIDEDDELPVANQISMINFVIDAFEMQSKHDEIMKKVESNEPPIIEAVDEGNEGFCFLTYKTDVVKLHTCLLKILLRHELESSSIPRRHWHGKFSFLATTILYLHSKHNFLSEIDIAFAKWSAFAEIHRQFALNVVVFKNIIDSVTDAFDEDNGDECDSIELPIFLRPAKKFIPACFGIMPQVVNGIKDSENGHDQLKTKDDDAVQIFWETTQSIIESFCDFIQNLFQNKDDPGVNDTLRTTLEVCIKINKLKLPSEFKIPIEDDIKNFLSAGASDHLLKSFKNEVLKSTNNELKLAELTELLRFAVKSYDAFIDQFGETFEQ